MYVPVLHDDTCHMYVQYFFDVQFRSSKKLEKLTFCCPFLIIASHNSSIAWFCTKSAMSCSWLCGISILRYGSDTFCWVDILCEDILKLHITFHLCFELLIFPFFVDTPNTETRTHHTTPPDNTVCAEEKTIKPRPKQRTKQKRSGERRTIRTPRTRLDQFIRSIYKCLWKQR